MPFLMKPLMPLPLPFEPEDDEDELDELLFEEETEAAAETADELLDE